MPLVRSAQTSFRNRTSEFQSVAERQRKSLSSGPVPNGPSSNGRAATVCSGRLFDAEGLIEEVQEA